jgi:hypothetical protein
VHQAGFNIETNNVRRNELAYAGLGSHRSF